MIKLWVKYKEHTATPISNTIMSPMSNPPNFKWIQGSKNFQNLLNDEIDSQLLKYFPQPNFIPTQTIATTPNPRISGMLKV